MIININYPVLRNSTRTQTLAEAPSNAVCPFRRPSVRGSRRGARQ